MEFGDVYHLPVFNTRRPDWQVLGDFPFYKKKRYLLIDKHYKLSSTETSSMISGESS